MAEPATPRNDGPFALPAIDDPGSTEAGIILLGQNAERLMAGVGFAALADDVALVTQAVDHARHGTGGFGLAQLVAAGARRWGAVRPAIAAMPPSTRSVTLREEWAEAEGWVRTVVPGAGAATVAYLTACWLRSDDIDRLAAERAVGKGGTSDVVSEVPAG